MLCKVIDGLSFYVFVELQLKLNEMVVFDPKLICDLVIELFLLYFRNGPKLLILTFFCWLWALWSFSPEILFEGKVQG